jgi:PAS domain S-box-containing protein
MPLKTTRFESLLEAVPDALVGMDQAGVIRFVNQQTEALFGYDRDELIGQHIEMLLPEPLWQIYAEHQDGYFADPRTRSSGLELELSGLKKDGTELPLNISLSHIDTGDVLLVITAVLDVVKQQDAVRDAQLMTAVVEFSNDAIVGSTLEGTIMSWNPAAERMYGYSGPEIIGKSGSLLTPEGRAGEFFANLASVKDGKAVERLETERLRKDGTVVPVSITVAPIRDEDGKIVGASAVHRDVSEQRLASEMAQRMAAMVEFSGEAIVGGTLDGVITSWNPAAERLFGYSSEEMIGQTPELLVPGDRADETGILLATTKAGHIVERFETMRVRKDGTAFPAVITASPIQGPDGSAVAIEGIIRDVTEQRQAFETVQCIAAIVEGSDDAIIGRTLEGTITSWNPAAERMFGYSAGEIIGRSVDVLIPRDRMAEVAAVVARIRAGQSVDHLETLRIRKDGTVFPGSFTFSPIRDEYGVIVGASVIGRDMTEQEHASRYARSLIEASLDPMATISPQGKIDDVNEATVQITGTPREALIGSDYAQYVTEPDKALTFFQQVFETGSLADFPLTVRSREGTLTDVRCNASVYRDIGGEVLGVLAAAHDVTRQRQALVVAERMAAIVESSDDAIISGTLEGIVMSWNPAAVRMYGYTGDEIIGKSINLLIPEGRRGEIAHILARVEAGQPVEHLETLRLRKDGTALPVSLTISPIRNADGEVVGTSAIHRDITELQHAARYARSLIEAGLDPLVTISPEGSIDDVNEATVRLTGLPRESLIGTDFSLYFTDPDKAIEGHRRAFDQGTVTDFPLTLRHRDGTLTDVLYNASVYRDTLGNVLGVFAAARDMTKQKEAFEAAERMAAIVEYSDDAIVGSTLDGVITSWNPAAERLYGHSREKIVGRSVDVLSPGDRTGEIGGILNKVKAGRPVGNVEIICLRKDKSTFPVKLTVAPIRGTDGAVVGASAIARDVTEQRQALAAAERMASIVEFSGEAIVGGTLDGVITSWNPAAERLFGYSAAEVIGKSAGLLSRETRTAEIVAVLARVNDGQAVENVEAMCVRKDAAVVPVSITFAPIRDAYGVIVGVSAMARDVTEQKETMAFTRRMAAIEFSGEAIISETVEGIITSWNPAAERLFGHFSEEVIGRSATILIPEDRSGEAAELMERIRAGERVENYETVRVRKDATVFPVSLTVGPIRDQDGTVTGASSTPRDITKQKEAFEAAERMAAMVENSADAIICQTLEGVVTSWNPAAERIYGYSGEEIIGKPIDLLSRQGRTGEVTSILARIKAGQPVEHHRTMRVRKDGTAIPVSLTISPIRGADGTVVGGSVIHCDLTEPT